MTPATSTARRVRTDPTSTPSRTTTGRRGTAPRTETAEAVLVVDLRVAAGDNLSTGASAVRRLVEEFGGAVVAALGRRVVGVFPAERVHDAIGAGVAVQRKAAASATNTSPGGARSDRAKGWNATVSVAVGPRPRADSYDGLGFTPVGPGVDVAIELCRRGLDASVLADDEAAGRVGAEPPVDADRRGWALGERRLLVGDGERDYSCREISFDLDGRDPEPSIEALVLRGLGAPKAPSSDRRGAPATGPTDDGAAAPGRRRAWSSGRVCCWFSDRGRGVIASTTGQEFYVDRRFLVVSGELDTGRTVFFVPRDPVARGRNPVAGAVLVEGAEIEARIEHVDERGFGFAQLGDTNGTRQLLLIDLTGYARIGLGDWLLLAVERADHGPIGRPV
jgi:hypothetical protein